MVITGATITIHGDPSVGIFDHQAEVEHLDFDLDLFAEEDREEAVEALRAALVAVGKAVSGEDYAEVFFHRGELLMAATAHVPSSCGPTMPSLLRMRFRQHLRVAIHCWRMGERDRAYYHLGVASGQVYALFDTVVQAYTYREKVTRVRSIFDKESHGEA